MELLVLKYILFFFFTSIPLPISRLHSVPHLYSSSSTLPLFLLLYLAFIFFLALIIFLAIIPLPLSHPLFSPSPLISSSPRLYSSSSLSRPYSPLIFFTAFIPLPLILSSPHLGHGASSAAIYLVPLSCPLYS